MTDKEQVIINNIDVSGCIELYSRWNKGLPREACALYRCDNPYDDDNRYLCKYNPDCLFKQLARKTQECEKLKEELRRTRHIALNQTNNVNFYEKDNDRYRKTLCKIEGLVKNFCKDCGDYENCNWDKEGCYYSLIPNLKDIINEVKKEML